MGRELPPQRDPRTELPFGDRTHLVASVVVAGLVVAGAIRLGLANRAFVVGHPMNVVWIGGGLVAGVAAPWLGYGILAAYFGFALQGELNGEIVRRLGSPRWWGIAALGLGAAGSQTLGKWILLRFTGKMGALDGPVRALATGLGVGLGFGLTEVVILGENQIVQQVAITGFPWIGIWERAVAIGLHVYSGAALAIGLYERRWVPLLIVLAVHSLVDTVAGAFSEGLFTVPVIGLEVFFTAMTILLGLYYGRLRGRLLAGAT